MAKSSWINAIKYNHDTTADNAETFYLGTTFDKVRETDNSTFSLQELVNRLKTFFSRQSFMLYSATKPAPYSRTMEWYALSGSTETTDSFLTLDYSSEDGAPIPRPSTNNQ